MGYSIAHIAQIIGAAPQAGLPPDTNIRYLLLDSRNLAFPQHSLFFALSGNRHDGHHFIADLYAAGLRNFVISQDIDTSLFPEAHFLRVANCLDALQQLAAFHRSTFSLPVLGITGSNGKTIVKEWLYQLLQADFSIVRSPKSYNSQIGVPLSVWQINSSHDFGIFEAGISQRGEMSRLAIIIQCELGLFTNLGAAHREGFSTDEEKLQEKLHLFTNAKTLFYSVDDPRVAAAIGTLEHKQFFSWSRQGKEADLQITQIQKTAGGTALTAIYQKNIAKIFIPFGDDASIENAIHCWAVMLHQGYPAQVIAHRMALLEPVGMRLELKTGINDCLLINDSYNTDWNALEIALNFMEQQGKGRRRHLILSDILQSGEKPQSLNPKIARLLKEKNIQRFTGIGENIQTLQQLLPASIESQFYPTTEAFLQKINLADYQSEIILIKGARRFSFERIANRLARQVHQTVLEINLSAMIHNLNIYSNFLKDTTKLMVMVKASAYGSGSHEVAKMLEYHHVDYLAVAYTDEGVDLRKAGIKVPIVVLNPEENTMESLIRHELEPEIYSLESLEQLIRHLPDEQTPINIHLKLETGMHRLGFEEKDIPHLLSKIKQYPQIRVISIFSHLAASDVARHDAFSREQIRRFSQLYAQLKKGLGYPPLRHLLNSSGISRFPEHQMDMVRLGIGLYGIDSSGMIQEKLQTVLTLKASISQIKTVEPEESIGYNRSARAGHKMRIGTISIGYADGLLRAAGNGRYHLLIRGNKVPIVGNVCMDMCMVDLSELPEATVGDEVIVFGEGLPVQELASCLNTIPYEIFTNISGRVKRVYIQE